VAERSGLTIGIDARAAAEPLVGRGRVVQELLRALNERDDPHRYLLYAREAWDVDLDARFRWRTFSLRDPWWHLKTARAASRECDVFLSSNSYLTLWFLSVPGVPIVYDLVAFDRSARPRRRSAIIEWLTLGLAGRRAAAFIAISQATANELTARVASARGRTRVAPLAAASAVVENQRNEPDDRLPTPGFVLAVGTLEPRKNLPRLAEAYGRLPETIQREHPLVVVGQVGWQASETLDALRSLGDRCRQLGRVSDAELGQLYRRCAVFCYPSLGEGFGLPVLEAMQCGAPVITSNCSSLPEVGGDAVEYVDPRDTGSIATALERLLGEPERRAMLARRGAERAKAFSWSRTAEITVRVLEQAAHREGSSS
jgi:glycosyltransferase involved in cell wall biosynthesis